MVVSDPGISLPQACKFDQEVRLDPVSLQNSRRFFSDDAAEFADHTRIEAKPFFNHMSVHSLFAGGGDKSVGRFASQVAFLPSRHSVESDDGYFYLWIPGLLKLR